MGVLSSKLVISLVDHVSGPASRVKSALAGIAGTAGMRRGFGMLGATMAAQASRFRSAAGNASAAAVPFAMLGRSAFESAYAFEKAMNTMEALGEMTKEQRRVAEAHIKTLSKKYPQALGTLGATMNELLRGGLKPDQAMGALDSVLAMSIYGDIDPALASEIAVNSLSQFRLPMDTVEQSAASMRRVSDVITYAANKSSTDVRLMGETFKYAAPIASMLGQSVEDLGAASMIMANAGIKGSEAGVAYRSALVRMVKPTKGMNQMLERLNINLADYVRNGRAVTASDVVSGLAASGFDVTPLAGEIEAAMADPALARAPARLNAKLTDIIATGIGDGSAIDKSAVSEALTDVLAVGGANIDFSGFIKAVADKAGPNVAQAFAHIFDVRQGARLLSLTGGDVATLVEEILSNSSGYAERGAQVMLQGIVGPFQQIGAAFSRLSSSILKPIAGDLAAAFTSLADAIDRLANVSPGLLKMATGAIAAVAVLGPLGLVLGGIGATFTMVSAGVRLLAAPFVALSSALFRVGAGATAAQAAGTALAASPLFGLGAGRMPGGKAAGAASARMIAGMGANAQASQRMVMGMSAFGQAAAMVPPGLGARFMSIAAGIGRVAVLAGRLTLVGVAIAGLTAALTWLTNNAAGIGSFFQGFADGFMKNLGPAKPMIEGIANAFSSILDWFSKILGPIDESGEKWRSWGETVGAAIAWPFAKLGELYEKLVAISSYLRDSTVGTWLLGERAAATPDDATAADAIVEPPAPASPAAAAVVDTAPAAAAVVESAPAVSPEMAPADVPSTGALDDVRSDAQGVVSAVTSAMSEVEGIVARVDLTAQGQRIAESLANGIRQGIGAIRDAASAATAAAAQNAVRGAYSDGGR